MAEQKVDQASLMPFAGEIGLAQYINTLFGGGSANNYGMGNLALSSAPTLGTAAQVAAPETLTANLQSELTPEDMNNLITEWLRGQGNFLGAAREQNTAGLYNTATRNLVSNDLMAQAALKATQANIPIKTANAQILNQVANANAQLKQQAASTNAQLLQQQQNANTNLATQVALKNTETQNAYNLALAKLKAATPTPGVLAGAAGISGLQAILNSTGLGDALKTGTQALTQGLLQSIFGSSGTSGTTKSRDKNILDMQDMASEELASMGVDTGGFDFNRDFNIQSMQDMASSELADLADFSASPIDYGLQNVSYSPMDFGSFNVTPVSYNTTPDYGYYSDYNPAYSMDFNMPSYDFADWSQPDSAVESDWSFNPNWSWGSGDGWSLPSFSFSF